MTSPDVPDIAGIVLAAGAGRRFSATEPKQLALVGDRPMLDHVLSAVELVALLDPLVLVLGARAGEVRAGAQTSAFEVVVCDAWDHGMSASLRAGIAAAGDVDWALIVLGDQPFITAQVIAMVADAALDAPADVQAVRATYDGVPGHPVALRAGLFPAVDALEGDAGARSLLRDVRVRTVQAGHLCSPQDIDTQEALPT